MPGHSVLNVLFYVILLPTLHRIYSVLSSYPTDVQPPTPGKGEDVITCCCGTLFLGKVLLPV